MHEIEPRLAQRRLRVAEGHARSNLLRVLWLMVALATLGGAVWLLRSPWLSLVHLEVRGVSSSRTVEILEESGIVAGTPLISVRPAAVEQALVHDPYISEAEVVRQWPNTVNVSIVERAPVAWVPLGEDWALVAEDGVTLRIRSEPDLPLPVLALAAPEEGEQASPVLLGALTFLAELRADIAVRARLEDREGELWMSIDGFEVRLGRPLDMKAKARALTPLLGLEIEPGSLITLIAPTRPAVLPPGAPVDPETKDESQVEP
jgi:cell division protein FtsQ